MLGHFFKLSFYSASPPADDSDTSFISCKLADDQAASFVDKTPQASQPEPPLDATTSASSSEADLMKIPSFEGRLKVRYNVYFHRTFEKRCNKIDI